MEGLIAALEQQLKLLEELHGLLELETKELSEIHLDSMADINSRKESVAALIMAHTSLLQKEILGAAFCEGLSAKVTLGELATFYTQKGKRKVSQLHEKLNLAAGRIRDLIGLNREIAERFAASVTGSLELLTMVINQSNTYGASGAYQQRSAGAVLINREA